MNQDPGTNGSVLMRGRVIHVPRNPFVEEGCLEAWPDGAVVVSGGRVQQVGEYSAVCHTHPGSITVDLRPAVILPGFVDTHVHFPQMPVIGEMGDSLLEWLDRHCLPQEARLEDQSYARILARSFIRSLIRNGTTTALVFGSHFPRAQHLLFEEAHWHGLDLASGLVMSDRGLPAALLLSPEDAYRESDSLLNRWHGAGRLRYAVTPRFALSASEEMLEASSALLKQHSDLLFTTHVNESEDEISAVKALFPWARDYVQVYDRFGLLKTGSILAHNVHATRPELELLARCEASIAHCPTSNAFLGSGLFPLRDHLEMGIGVGLGTDVGAGTGFGIFKEALAAYQLQRLRPDGYPLSPAHLLFLMTGAGAKILGRYGEVGDFREGKRADMVVVNPRQDTTLAEMWGNGIDDEHLVGTLCCLGGEEHVQQVYIAGELAWDREPESAH